MKRFLTHQIPFAGVPCCLLLAVISGAALAQTSSPADPSRVPAASSAKEGNMPAPGGCKPIGLTVSGEVVFPLECKEFIERMRDMDPKPAAAEAKPAAAEAKPAAPPEKPAVAEEKPTAAPEKPAVAEDKPPVAKDKAAVAEDKPAAVEEKPTTADAKAAVKPSDDAAPDNGPTGTTPADLVPLPKRGDRKPREHTAGAPGCTHFRSYNAASGTYRSFDGQIRPCR
jgi:outer membrane biosynthesis protein TonB